MHVLAAVAVLLFVAAVILMIVAIANGTFGRPGSAARLGVVLSLASVPFTLVAMMLKRSSARLPRPLGLSQFAAAVAACAGGSRGRGRVARI